MCMSTVMPHREDGSAIATTFGRNQKVIQPQMTLRSQPGLWPEPMISLTEEQGTLNNTDNFW